MSFINDIKLALVQMHEEEREAIKALNPLHANGISQARIMLEMVLDKHGIERPMRVDTSKVDKLISIQ